MKYTAPKGVFDILPKQSKNENYWQLSDRWLYIEKVIRNCAHDYGYREVRTPIFEQTNLFVQGAGESSDVVTKEMYTFLDKRDRSMSLRPEGTAPIIRAFIENHLDQTPGLYKYFYIGPMFRYERPQSGRYRQHHQFGAEAIGIKTPEQDVELIDFLYETYRRLGIADLTVIINSVGDEEARGFYRKALTDYLQPHFLKLSTDSQTRFKKNILRILDSKDPQDQKIIENAPPIAQFFSQETKEYFEKIQHLLIEQKIPFTVNPNLVRGLDYYNHTVFEIVSHSLKAQNSIGGGGRYDGLVAKFGGADLPSVGFGTGLERVLQTMIAQNCHFQPQSPSVLFLIGIGIEGFSLAFSLLCSMRHQGIAVEMDLSGKKIQHGLQMANNENARFSVIIGDKEIQGGSVEIKEMATRTTQVIPLNELEKFIKGVV
jgi:histidyl-tRNA synthetase